MANSSCSLRISAVERKIATLRDDQDLDPASPHEGGGWGANWRVAKLTYTHQRLIIGREVRRPSPAKMRSHASAIRPTRALAALLLLSSAAADFRVKCAFNCVYTFACAWTRVYRRTKPCAKPRIDSHAPLPRRYRESQQLCWKSVVQVQCRDYRRPWIVHRQGPRGLGASRRGPIPGMRNEYGHVHAPAHARLWHVAHGHGPL